MLRMDQIHVIRHKVLIEGQSIGRVARELGLSRNTVSKYLDSSEAGRSSGRVRSRPVWERVRTRLDELVEEWGPRTTAKQRLTGSLLQHQLTVEGYQVGTSLVRQYLREVRRQRQEVYIPLIHRPGEEAQVDFFEVVVELGGEWLKAWEFLVRLMYSGREFAWLYERCDQLAFLDGHVRAFAYLGGVVQALCLRQFKTGGAPNRRCATSALGAVSGLGQPLPVRAGFHADRGRARQGRRGEPRQGDSAATSHANSARGSLAEVSQGLLLSLEQAFSARRNAEGKSANELWAEERTRLLALPAVPFAVSRMVSVEVSSQALVKVEGATYSVPSRWARLSANAYVGVDQIRIVCLGESVTHSRARSWQPLGALPLTIPDRSWHASPKRCAKWHPN